MKGKKRQRVEREKDHTKGGKDFHKWVSHIERNRKMRNTIRRH